MEFGRGLLAKGWRHCVIAAVVIGSSLPVIAVSAETQPAAVEQTASVAQAATETAAQAEVAIPDVGDFDAGKAFFTGGTSFKNGGPPCISCHSAGVGKLGGGLLGPNLTKVYADPAKQALLNIAWVNSPGIPVMGPIFSNKNITEEEMNHLKAFLKAASEKEVAPSSTGKFTLISLLGSVGVLIFFSIVWSNRYSKRNQNTAHDALWRNYGGKGGR